MQVSNQPAGFIRREELHQPGAPSTLGGAPAVAASQLEEIHPEPTAPSAGKVPYLGPEEGHWIKRIANGGRTIVLEDDSTWQVDAGEDSATATWAAMDDIIVRESGSALGGYTLTNVTQDKTVGARHLGKS